MSAYAESSAISPPVGPRLGEHFVVRPARADDLDSLYGMAVAAGPGMTNLPPDRDVLAARLADGMSALASPEMRSRGRAIFFVVERVGLDGPRGADPVVGSACIFPRIGVEWPFYSYRMTRQAQTSKALDKQVVHDLLILTNDFNDCAEVGGLFVDRGARGGPAGRLAARGRYLFLAEHRDWFGRQVIAEMRGYQDQTGASPVWEALGREFYDMEFASADRLNAVTGSQFIADLGPKHPIYASLLPKAAREALGRTHDAGRRALTMLQAEGFRFDGYVDIFDGGPTLTADIDDLMAVKDSRRAQIARIAPHVGLDDRLVSTGVGAAFRVGKGGLVIDDDGAAAMDETLAVALDVRVGDQVRHVAF